MESKYWDIHDEDPFWDELMADTRGGGAMDKTDKASASRRHFWRGYIMGVLTGAGLVCAVLMFSCAPGGTPSTRPATNGASSW